MASVSVIGATGRQGLAQIKQLLNSGYNVRALSRSKNPASLGSMAKQVEIEFMDLEDEATIAPALQGTDYVFLNFPLNLTAQRVELVEAVGKACKKADVSRLVWNTSSWIPERPGDSHTYGRNIVAINKLWALGTPTTVFGAVLFMDNLLTDWARPSLMNDKRYIYPHAPDIGANWISLADVAKVMIASLDRPDMVGAWMNIGGPEKLNGPSVAKILSNVLGFELNYDPYTPEEFADALADALDVDMPQEARNVFTDYISDFYHYNNTAPTQPFSVNEEYVRSRLPEVKFETLEDWATRQDWNGSAARPSGG